MTDVDFARIEAEALELLKVLCRLPSVSAEGRALEETATLVQQLLDQAGFATRQLRAAGGPPAVWGHQQGRDGFTLLLYSHYDVQPVEPLELWDSPPFEPTLRDGRLFGRGTADNKGELAVRLAVIRALREAHGELPISVRWIIEGEEEVGSPHFDEIARENADLLRADACLWEGLEARLSDGRPTLTLGFKGLLTVRLDVTRLRGDQHSMNAVVLPSAAWTLVAALASLRGADGTIRIDGFSDAVQPPTGPERTAIAEAGDAIERGLRDASGVEAFLDGLTGPALLERMGYGPTANIAGIRTGYAGPGMKTVLPSDASAWLDFRLVPDQRPEDVLALLRSHLDTHGFEDVALTAIGMADSAGTPIDHPFARRVADIAQKVAKRPVSITPRHPGPYRSSPRLRATLASQVYQRRTTRSVPDRICTPRMSTSRWRISVTRSASPTHCSTNSASRRDLGRRVECR